MRCRRWIHHPFPWRVMTTGREVENMWEVVSSDNTERESFWRFLKRLAAADRVEQGSLLLSSGNSLETLPWLFEEGLVFGTLHLHKRLQGVPDCVEELNGCPLWERRERYSCSGITIIHEPRVTVSAWNVCIVCKWSFMACAETVAKIIQINSVKDSERWTEKSISQNCRSEQEALGRGK